MGWKRNINSVRVGPQKDGRGGLQWDGRVSGVAMGMCLPWAGDGSRAVKGWRWECNSH